MLEVRMDEHPRGRVRVAEIGDGPPVVLLHGYPDNLQIFSAVAPLLAKAFRVIAFDWPGMGMSDVWPGGTTPEHMATRLVELLDHWRIERANVVGMDMGGQPALVLAARHPDRVDALAVMNSLAFGDLETSWEIGLLRRYRWNERLIRLLPALVFSRAVRTSLPRRARLPADLRWDLWAGFRRREVRRFVSRMCGGYQGALPGLPGLYGLVQCPTLILWGERDRHFPLPHARGLHAAIPGSRLQIVADGEHWMVWQQPHAVGDALVGFLTGRG
jgi:pimeloyl-ACP methyl ester carboxylesterase